MSKLNINSVVSSGCMKMPMVGLGTWQLNENVQNGENAVKLALEAGYRHIDTAYVYLTEGIIGSTIDNLISSGKYTREEIFLVTKLPQIGNRPEYVEKYLKESLTNLKMDYVDLYLIHWPGGLKNIEGKLFPVDENGLVLIDVETDIVALWKEMEKQVDAGRAKSIGLSNFNIDQMQRILKEARIPPANLQVELHVYFQQKELLTFCKENNITVCAYAPLGSPSLKAWNEKHDNVFDTSISNSNPLSDPLVIKIAEKHKKSPGQVLLRLILQLGVAVIPKSTNPDRIRSNINVFDFELSAEEMAQLEGLDRKDGRIFGSGLMKGLSKHPECPF